MSHHDRTGAPRVFQPARRHPRSSTVEQPRALRMLERSLPGSWRFARQAGLDLLRQIEFLGWADRADVFDTYFVRQAEGMLRPEGLADLLSATGGSGPTIRTHHTIAGFAAWTRTLVTSVLFDLNEPVVVREPDQALTYVLSRDLMRARAAVRWAGGSGPDTIGEALERLPGYALVLLASSPSDTAERFAARDAFWSAVYRAQR